ncbi:MAG: flavodoxin family protein [Oscillospiraceae bacterium]|nr:flavodoxin family protein [Oscillospiraceae bacterium]
MKVLMINGSPHRTGCTYTALSEVAKTLAKHGIDSEIFNIGAQPISGCIACRSCHKTGKCVIDDSVNALNARMDEFRGMVIGSPVYYAGPSGQLTAFLDRLFYSGKLGMTNMPGACVVSCRRGGASAAFDRLNKYFTIANMPVVSSQYWNQVHGSVAEDVLQDEEGLQTMRTLGENMAWLIKCIEAGKSAGVPLPAREQPVRTDFIR